VLTTCARDYLTWRNEFPAGIEQVNGITVERFRVVRERTADEFGDVSRRVFGRTHTVAEELEWLHAQGPVCPGLIGRLRRTRRDFDFAVLFSLRYYQSYYGARAVAEQAILVPTAEREPAIALEIFGPALRGVRGIMYNSPEERALIQQLAVNDDVPGVVVGVGSRIAPDVEADRARHKFGLVNPFIVYVGRIDPNKGCGDLFAFFADYNRNSGRQLDLVLIGTIAMSIPEHPNIRHLGYVSDQDKFDVIAAAEALVMPSFYESLSMVALEAWALGRPVLANARCDVLVGQCIRSGAGLYYDNAREFHALLDVLFDDRPLVEALGRNGREYFARHYSWPVIERKYLQMFERLKASAPSNRMERVPGWFARRRPTVRAAAERLDRVPSGPALDRQSTVDELEPPA
jgi:glycosyltransferase involved in cell wall biosynthesis